MENTSVRNLLLDFYISLTDTSDKEQTADMKQMVSSMTVPKFATHKNTVNKAQRYACLRKLILAQQGMTADVTQLIDAERKIDFSASDELEMIKLQACCPNRVDKQKIWDKYVAKKDNYKQ